MGPSAVKAAPFRVHACEVDLAFWSRPMVRHSVGEILEPGNLYELEVFFVDALLQPELADLEVLNTAAPGSVRNSVVG